MTIRSVTHRARSLTRIRSDAPGAFRCPPASLADRYRSVRDTSLAVCEPLEIEDYVVQSMVDSSPTKWHLAHTTWFFETFVLSTAARDYRSPDPQFRVMFNSYYKSVGKAHARPRRGLSTRPTVREVVAYRRHVDECVLKLLADRAEKDLGDLAGLIDLGLHHEQQHQESILADIKHAFSANPLRPAFRDLTAPPPTDPADVGWHRFEEGVREIGHAGDGFAYDNESPRHRVFVRDFELAGRLVTNAEFLAFAEDGGYERSQLWLSDGWDAVEAGTWSAPLYWERRDGQWWTFTLGGMRRLNPAEPVCHVSFYEADAYARWAGARLPTEAEWEITAFRLPIDGNLLERDILHPAPADPDAAVDPPRQMFGDVWEWTASPYVGYPGYRPAAGSIGEYNGKFMCNQMVLRGGSCLTSRTHIRPTYRNFLQPESRWQMTGFRLARDTRP